MKKKILLSIIILMSVILIDTVYARVFKTSPLLSIKKELDNSDSFVDKGILMDTYYCTKERDIVTVSWHFKTTKFNCPIDNDNIRELDNVNNKIIEYFLSDNNDYDNLSFHYIDEDSNLVVVGLLDNSIEKQEEFREKIVDSDLINFIEIEENINLPIEEEENTCGCG